MYTLLSTIEMFFGFLLHTTSLSPDTVKLVLQKIHIEVGLQNAADFFTSFYSCTFAYIRENGLRLHEIPKNKLVIAQAYPIKIAMWYACTLPSPTVTTPRSFTGPLPPLFFNTPTHQPLGTYANAIHHTHYLYDDLLVGPTDKPA